MRKLILCLIFFVLCSLQEAAAQFDKNYFYYVGRNYISDNRSQDAIEILNVLLRVDDKAYEGYFLRGIAKYNLDDLIGACQDFTAAIERNPVYTIAYQYRAITLSRLGEYDSSIRDFGEAIGLRPDIAGSYYGRGVTYLMSQQFEKAINDLDYFIQREKKVVDAYINRGISYLCINDTVKAYENFDMAIRTNREDPEGYSRRGMLYLRENKYDLALEDFNSAIKLDPAHLYSYFHRSQVYSALNRPLEAIADLGSMAAVDSTNAVVFFNRAILRSQIGDFNNALDDYGRVASLNPGNVLVYYNRAALYTRMGDYRAAVEDYSRAIELYPEFSNAYLGRSELRYRLLDYAGAQSDKNTAERKIAEYRAKLADNSYSIYADTSRRFNQLLSFDAPIDNSSTLGREVTSGSNVTLLPMFRFSLMAEREEGRLSSRYYLDEMDAFMAAVGDARMRLVNKECDLAPDSLVIIDAAVGERLLTEVPTWQLLFERGVTQSLVRQYTSSIASYTSAIDHDPSNAFLYFNRSTTQSEMIDFISSIDNSYQRVSFDADPSLRLRESSSRTYSYDEAIADLNKAAKLMPRFAHIYYNRANLYCRSGMLPAALEDYTRAIELNPNFGEAYYNRGLVQIFLKDTGKGILDLSKAGELGVQEAYAALKLYSKVD